VHDVAETVQALAVLAACRAGEPPAAEAGPGDAGPVDAGTGEE
jgi:hypothetical protein